MVKKINLNWILKLHATRFQSLFGFPFKSGLWSDTRYASFEFLSCNWTLTQTIINLFGTNLMITHWFSCSIIILWYIVLVSAYRWGGFGPYKSISFFRNIKELLVTFTTFKSPRTLFVSVSRFLLLVNSSFKLFFKAFTGLIRKESSPRMRIQFPLLLSRHLSP